MIRTPEQAAEVWCRHARILNVDGIAALRTADEKRNILPATCISIACMSWRWWDQSYVVLVVNPRDVKPETMKRLADDGYERWPEGDRDGGHGYRLAVKTRRGYCGADSKPVHPE